MTDTPRPVGWRDVGPLSADGPWLAFESDEGLWITDPEGSTVKQVVGITGLFSYPIPFAASAAGAHLAYAEPLGARPLPARGYLTEPRPSPGPEGPLFIIHLPDMTPLELPFLISAEATGSITTNYPWETEWVIDSARYHLQQLRTAVTHPSSMVWSPDGTRLAFSAAIDGPTSDLYIYDAESRAIRRLTSGQAQAANLLWSLDGRYIIHNAVEDFAIERNGIDEVDGLWAAAADGSTVVRIGYRYSQPMGWLSSSDLLVGLFDFPCDFLMLTRADIPTGNVTQLWGSEFTSVATDPETGAVLLGNPYDPPGDSICPVQVLSGLYIFPPGQASPVRLGDFEPIGFDPSAIRWADEDGHFTVHDAEGLRLFTPGGVQAGATPYPLSEATLRTASADACNTLWNSDHTLLAFSDDNTVSVFDQSTGSERVLSTEHNGLCQYDLQWIEK